MTAPKRARRTKAQVQQLEQQIHDVLAADHPQSVRHVFYRMTDPRLLLQARAILELRPDLVAEIDADRMTLTQAMPAAYRAFTERLLTEAREHAEGTRCEAL